MKILLCDSDPSSRAAMARLLQMVDAGGEVEICATGADAIERLEREPFDALMLDTELPLLDGFETLDLIRRAEHLRGLPVVIVTRDRSRESVVRSLELAVTDYMIKPVRRRRLVGSLAAIAARRRHEETRAAAPAPVDVPSRSRLLIVDGEEDFREAVTRILAPHVAVSAAATGGAALNDAWDEAPAMVLIGRNVGPIGPLSLARYLKRLGGPTLVKFADPDDPPATTADDVYAGEIPRSTDPDVILREVGRFIPLPVPATRGLVDKLLETIPEVQGVIASRTDDIFQSRLAQPAEVREAGSTDIIGAHALVQLTLGPLAIRLAVQCTTDLIRHLAAGAGPDEDLRSSVGILGEIALDLARDLRNTAPQRGMACDHGEPWFAAGASSRDGLPAGAERMVMEMAPAGSDGRFRVVLDVYENC